jgi:hypothetical protein
MYNVVGSKDKKQGGSLMSNKKLIASVSLNNEKELLPKKFKELNLEYYVFEKSINDEANRDLKSYGIEIVKKEILDENITIVERKFVDDICVCEKWIKELVNKLIENTVTPVSLDNILEDAVGVV